MFEFADHSLMELKGFPPMLTHWLLKSNNKSLWDIIDRPRGMCDSHRKNHTKIGENNTIDGFKEFADLSVYLPGADELNGRVFLNVFMHNLANLLICDVLRFHFRPMLRGSP